MGFAASAGHPGRRDGPLTGDAVKPPSRAAAERRQRALMEAPALHPGGVPLPKGAVPTDQDGPCWLCGADICGRAGGAFTGDIHAARSVPAVYVVARIPILLGEPDPRPGR
jgi:hypothetical protein